MADASQHKTVILRFFITGFGRFCGVDDNPTTILVRWLASHVNGDSSSDSTSDHSDTQHSQIPSPTEPDLAPAVSAPEQYKWQPLDVSQLHTSALQHSRGESGALVGQQTSSAAASADTPSSVPALCSHPPLSPVHRQPPLGDTGVQLQLTCEVLTVSVQAVDDFFSQLPGMLGQALASEEENTERVAILLHLGVDAKATGFKLENTAYNNMTFRIPDECGYTPDSAPINPASCLDAPLCTPIDLPQLHTRLMAAGFSDKQCTISHDPGRFLCNYIYYRSLELTRAGCTHRSSSRALEEGVSSSSSDSVDTACCAVPASMDSRGTPASPACVGTASNREIDMLAPNSCGASGILHALTHSDSLVTIGAGKQARVTPLEAVPGCVMGSDVVGCEPAVASQSAVMVQPCPSPGSRSYSLFVHVPSFETVDRVCQQSFVAALMLTLVEQLSVGMN
ncbi:MAG: hypothetical protein WDW38_010971 [Sanguina aurantia]